MNDSERTGLVDVVAADPLPESHRLLHDYVLDRAATGRSQRDRARGRRRRRRPPRPVPDRRAKTLIRGTKRRENAGL